MKGFDILLAVVSLASAVGLLYLLIRRRLLSEFPFFILYLSASITFPIVKISVSGSYRTFFIVSWTAEAIYVLLALLALQEVFRKVFAAFYEKRWFWLFFPVVVIAVSALAIFYRLGSPPAQANPVMSFIISMGMAVNLVQALLFVLFFVLVWFNGIGWREYPFGIVMGFAAISTGGFIANWSRSVFGTKSIPLFSYAPPVAYILAVILWLNTFLRPPEPEPQWRLKITPEQLLEEIRQYGKVLGKFRGKS